jgi:bifunctional non-homologous end joining protein LigD
VRARPGAPVSTPLTWEEVARGGFEPADYDLESVPARLRRQGDPLAACAGKRQRLPEA